MSLVLGFFGHNGPSVWTNPTFEVLFEEIMGPD